MIVEYAETELIPKDTLKLYNVFIETFGNIEGGSLSQYERNIKNLLGSEYTYGEIEFLYFLPLLNYVSVGKEGGTFWDLGCGTGKVLIAAALSDAGFRRICGVEYLEGLYQTSLKAIDLYWKIAKQAGLKSNKDKFNIVKGDMKIIDWSDADVVYTSSICFPEELIQVLTDKGRCLKKGARIITLMNWVDPNAYKILYYFKVRMTWGHNSVYVLERI